MREPMPRIETAEVRRGLLAKFPVLFGCCNDEYLFYVYYFQGVQLFRKHVAGSEEHQNQGDNLILFHNWFYFGCKVTRNLQYVQS